MDLDLIVHEYHVACSPAHAFDVWVTRAGQWWDPVYSSDPTGFEDLVIGPHRGGRVVARYAGGREETWGEVLSWEPGAALAYTSTLAQTPAHPSMISVTFSGDGDTTAMHFEHGGWHEGNASFRQKFGDWPVLLGRFVALAGATGGAG